MSEQSRAAASFARFVVPTADAAAAERVSAEAWGAGAAGIEEREAADGAELVIYAPLASIEAVWAAVAGSADAGPLGVAEPVPDTDWTETWKQGLVAVEISPRLRVRPSFVETPAAPGQSELVVDPAQAFGTGGHESTRLALEWIDAIAPELPQPCRMLDVGTGTGVLALAAIRLAGVRAVAFDIDPLAVTAARDNAGHNGIQSGLELFVGPLAAVAGPRFELVVANLLKSELMPLIPSIAEHTAPGGAAIFSGVLSAEGDEVIGALCEAGFTSVDAREATDANGDGWIGLLMRR